MAWKASGEVEIEIDGARKALKSYLSNCIGWYGF